MRQLMIIFAWLLSMAVSAGVEFREFKDSEQEQAYNSLIAELRCLVCQNQNIAESNADLAKDLRRQVYEMLHQGKNRQEIADFMIERYGDFVMYRPQFHSKTLVLWLAPLAFLLAGLLAVAYIIKNKRKQPVADTLDEKKKAEIHALLDDENNDPDKGEGA